MGSSNFSIHHTFLFITAIIWGSAFIFQKTAMDSIDPYLYSSLRFFAGSFSLIPIILFLRRKEIFLSREVEKKRHTPNLKYLQKHFLNQKLLKNGFIAGILLTMGVNLQQVALYYTQVAKVGFITSFYILLVPLLGFFFGKQVSLRVFLPVIIALVGFYFLSFGDLQSGFNSIFFGDIITLISSFFWALHIIYIDTCSKNFDNFIFSFLQFFFCGFFTLIFVFASGIEINWTSIQSSGVEILYGGVISVGIGYTLQVFGQKKVEPYIASMIISLEAVFAVLFEMIILKSFLNSIEILGSILLFSAVIYSQFSQKINFK